MKQDVSTIALIRDPDDFSPFPVAARAGEYVFAPCVVNLTARDPRPLARWRSRHEASMVLDRLGSVMKRAGGGLDGVVNLLQCFEGRGQTAGYVEERRGYFPGGVPTSTGTGATRLAAPGSLIQLDALGIVPAPGRKFEYWGGTSKHASYSNALSYDDLVFYSGVMTNVPETEPDPQLWFGSAVKNQLRYIIQQKLAQVLKDSGCAANDIVVAHFHLLDPVADFGPFCEVVEELFPTRKPVFLVSPSSGLGALPGRIEITPIAIRPGGRTVVEDIAVDGLGAGMLGGPQAKRVGDLVFLSTQAAVNAVGRLEQDRVDARASHMVGSTAAEMEEIVRRIEEVCEAAGTSTRQLVRLRLYVTDIANASAAVAVVRRLIGDHVPLSVLEDAGGAGWLGEASVTADAVAYAPR